MKTSKYLYDSDLYLLQEMLYIDALQYKIKLAEKNLEKLLSVSYMERESQHITDVISAIKFNKKLLNELNSKENDKEDINETK